MEDIAHLDRTYYLWEDVVAHSRDLLGKKLCARIQGKYTSGIITETEAYTGIHDRGSHAYGNRRTKRTETMFREGGVAYIYLCYGIHALFNVITGTENNPLAILIRGIQPLEGVDIMIKRRNTDFATLADGPGKLTKAMGITTSLNGELLTGDTIWLEDYSRIPEKHVKSGPRVGINYAGEDAKLPYRFIVNKKSK